jgi:hypothetical protein
MKGVTISSLSPAYAQRNWIFREDTEYLQLDGKTPCTFTVVIHCFKDSMCRIGDNLETLHASEVGNILEISSLSMI